MKLRIFVTLLLSTILALPAFAQQTTTASAQPAASADQTASTSQNVSATGKGPLQSPARGDWWDGDEPSLSSLVLHPFANKKYVQRHLSAVQDRLNELDELSASNAKLIREVDDHAQQGIQLASAKANEADQHAMDASNKAQMAQQSATAATTRLSTVETVVGNIDQYKTGTQTVIRFRPGQSALSKPAKDALDEMATPLKDQHGYVIEVQGFSSGHGQAAIAASRKMADSVVRYLVLNHEIPAYRIYLVSMGSAPAAGEDAAATKSASRVEVSLLKNDADQLASTTGATSAPAQPK